MRLVLETFRRGMAVLLKKTSVHCNFRGSESRKYYTLPLLDARSSKWQSIASYMFPGPYYGFLIIVMLPSWFDGHPQRPDLPGRCCLRNAASAASAEHLG